MPALSPSRAELLRALMRRHRARLTRTQIGLPPRPTARGRLTQEDLAEATGYSIQVIRQLETGRLRHPSAQLLAAVATTLILTPQESEDLWLLASATMPGPIGYATRTDRALTELVDVLDPHPALVTDALWTVKHHNHALTQWLPGAGEPPGQANFAEWGLLSPVAREVFANWERDLVPLVIGVLRTATARYPDDSQLTDLTRRLRTSSDAANRAWSRLAEPSQPHSRTVSLRRLSSRTESGRAGHTSAAMTVLTPLSRDDGRILVALLLPTEVDRDAPSTAPQRLLLPSTEIQTRW